MEKQLANIANDYSSFATQLSLPFQPDSLLRPSAQDSAEARQYGIDPLFIMNERKAREIEEYKQKQQRIAAWLAKQAAKPKQDTTCYICPNGDIVDIKELIVQSTKTIENFSLFDVWLTDKADYTELKPLNTKPFFQNAEVSTTVVPKELKEKERAQQPHTHSGWFFFPLLGLFFMLAILKVFYARFVNYFIQSALYAFVATKIERENSLLGNRILLMLDIIYFLSSSLLAVKLFDYYNVFDKSIIPIPLQFIYVMVFLLVFRVFKYLFVKIAGYTSQTVSEMKELYFHQLIFTRVFGVFLIPMLLIFAFSDQRASTIVLYLIVSMFGILMIVRTFRSFQVFIRKGFSIFYFLLYLCALEIAPVIVFIKEIFWE